MLLILCLINSLYELLNCRGTCPSQLLSKELKQSNAYGYVQRIQIAANLHSLFHDQAGELLCFFFNEAFLLLLLESSQFIRSGDDLNQTNNVRLLISCCKHSSPICHLHRVQDMEQRAPV